MVPTSVRRNLFFASRRDRCKTKRLRSVCRHRTGSVVVVSASRRQGKGRAPYLLDLRSLHSGVTSHGCGMIHMAACVGVRRAPAGVFRAGFGGRGWVCRVTDCHSSRPAGGQPDVQQTDRCSTVRQATSTSPPARRVAGQVGSSSAVDGSTRQRRRCSSDVISIVGAVPREDQSRKASHSRGRVGASLAAVLLIITPT